MYPPHPNSRFPPLSNIQVTPTPEAMAMMNGDIYPYHYSASSEPFNTTNMTERRESFLMLYDLLRDSPGFNYPAVDQMAQGLRSANPELTQ